MVVQRHCIHDDSGLWLKTVSRFEIAVGNIGRKNLRANGKKRGTHIIRDHAAGFVIPNHMTRPNVDLSLGRKERGEKRQTRYVVVMTVCEEEVQPVRATFHKMIAQKAKARTRINDQCVKFWSKF